ncbi:MAG: DMT family transporter [Treponema sp.]|jgi:drug/metabolite transporter (DMT)-like permease|nr:DMT family transporter [Treponema sp.]
MGQGAVLLCAILWSTSGLFIKLVDWHPVVLAGSRSFLAVLVLLALKGRRRDGKRMPGWKTQDRFFIIAGGAAYGATMITFVIANKLTASANAILLQYSAPVWAALLGWGIAREKPRWEQWGALVFVSLGLFLFFKDGIAAGSLPGDTLALCSGILFGANSVFLRMIRTGDTADAMLLAHVIAALVSLPFFFFYPPNYTPGTAAAIAFMGIIQMGAASQLFSYGIKRIPAIQAMLTAMVEPILNPLWVLMATGEKPAVPALIGGSVIVGAVIASSLIGSTWRRRS